MKEGLRGEVLPGVASRSLFFWFFCWSVNCKAVWKNDSFVLQFVWGGKKKKRQGTKLSTCFLFISCIDFFFFFGGLPLGEEFFSSLTNLDWWHGIDAFMTIVIDYICHERKFALTLCFPIINIYDTIHNGVLVHSNETETFFGTMRMKLDGP